MVTVIKYNLPHSIDQRLGTRIVGYEAGKREPGQVEAGTSAETEWAWEPQTEKPPK